MNNERNDYILAIEDDEHMRDFIVAVLSTYRVIAVETGEEALNHIKKEIPKLVLLDLILPGMTGHEVAKQLAQQKIPFIITSASTDWDIILQAISHGARAFIAKPFMPIELQAAVVAALQQTASTQDNNYRITSDNHNAILACGILSARFNITEQEAYSMLENNAANKQKDIPTLAAEIIHAHEDFLHLTKS